MSLLPVRNFVMAHPGIYQHRGRLGIVRQSGATYIFTALDPDGSLFTDAIFICPPIAGRTWQSALTDTQQDNFDETRWREDYGSFVARVRETIEDRLIDDEEDSRLVYYNSARDETYIKWRDEGVERLTRHVVKDCIATFQWYSDDKGLDKALYMLRAIPVDVPLSGIRNWVDYKRSALLMTLQQNVYQSIIDKLT